MTDDLKELYHLPCIIVIYFDSLVPQHFSIIAEISTSPAPHPQHFPIIWLIFSGEQQGLTDSDVCASSVAWVSDLFLSTIGFTSLHVFYGCSSDQKKNPISNLKKSSFSPRVWHVLWVITCFCSCRRESNEKGYTLRGIIILFWEWCEECPVNMILKGEKHAAESEKCLLRVL